AKSHPLIQIEPECLKVLKCHVYDPSLRELRQDVTLELPLVVMMQSRPYKRRLLSLDPLAEELAHGLLERDRLSLRPESVITISLGEPSQVIELSLLHLLRDQHAPSFHSLSVLGRVF